MKNVVGVILTFILLSSIGCESHNIDARLALADSLIVDHADSAYTVLKAIDSEELLSESDRAFYALLYTQAQYKNVDSIGSDSLINFALDYYKDNHNREHYTRTLIYKGAVMEELGNPEEALEWYLRAENNAAPDDYLNLGQANLRMSVLYSTHYIGDGLDLEKDRAALHYFRLADNKRYELMCLSSLGGGFRIYNMDSAYYYLDKALELAEEMGNEGEFYSCTEMKVRGMLEDSLHHEAKTLALDYLNTKGTEYVDDDLYYDLANAYIGLGNADSAQYYFNKTAENPQNENLIVIRLICLEKLSQLCKDKSLSYDLNIKSDKIADNIIYSKNSNELIKREQLFNKNRQINHIKNKNNIILFILSTLLILSIFIYINKRVSHGKRVKEYKKIIQDLQCFCEENQKYYELQNNTCNLNVVHIVTNYIQFVNELKVCIKNFEQTPKTLVRKVNNILKSVQDNKNNIGEQIQEIVNAGNDNILKRINLEYKQLTSKDLSLIAMIYCGFSSVTIGACLGYTHEKSIYQRKKQIAQKMEIDVNLDDFVAQKRYKEKLLTK